MPEQVRCPDCNAALRVPDNLLGKNVKCPKCQTTFLAESDEPAPSERVTREPKPASRRRPPPPEDEEEESPPEEQLDELEEEPEEEEYEERPRRRKRGGRRRAAAEAAVSAPATALIVLGGFDIFLVVVDLILSLVGVNFVPAGAGGPGGAGANMDFSSSPAVAIPGHILGISLATLILTGGLKMKQLQSYGMAITASILALLPCGNCCCIGLPLGIWALVVLNRGEVKDAFR